MKVNHSVFMLLSYCLIITPLYSQKTTSHKKFTSQKKQYFLDPKVVGISAATLAAVIGVTFFYGFMKSKEVLKKDTKEKINDSIERTKSHDALLQACTELANMADEKHTSIEYPELSEQTEKVIYEMAIKNITPVLQRLNPSLKNQPINSENIQESLEKLPHDEQTLMKEYLCNIINVATLRAQDITLRHQTRKLAATLNQSAFTLNNIKSDLTERRKSEEHLAQKISDLIEKKAEAKEKSSNPI